MTEQRRSKRFELRLPMELVGAGGYAIGTPCETRNLSSGGVLFRTTESIEVGDFIEYRIILPSNHPNTRPILLHCRGKVLRRQINGGGAVNFAATLERYEFVRAESVGTR